MEWSIFVGIAELISRSISKKNLKGISGKKNRKNDLLTFRNEHGNFQMKFADNSLEIKEFPVGIAEGIAGFRKNYQGNLKRNGRIKFKKHCGIPEEVS